MTAPKQTGIAGKGIVCNYGLRSHGALRCGMFGDLANYLEIVERIEGHDNR